MRRFFAVVTLPWSGSVIPAIIFKRVDFPVPFMPIMPAFSFSSR